MLLADKKMNGGLPLLKTRTSRNKMEKQRNDVALQKVLLGQNERTFAGFQQQTSS